MGFRIKLMSIPTPRGGGFDLDMCTETITEVCKLRLVRDFSSQLAGRELNFALVSLNQMSTESEKTVLVHLGERARPVKFFGGTKELLSAIRSSFRDVLIGNEEMILQVGLLVCCYVCRSCINMLLS